MNGELQTLSIEGFVQNKLYIIRVIIHMIIYCDINSVFGSKLFYK